MLRKPNQKTYYILYAENDILHQQPVHADSLDKAMVKFSTSCQGRKPIIDARASRFNDSSVKTHQAQYNNKPKVKQYDNRAIC